MVRRHVQAWAVPATSAMSQWQAYPKRRTLRRVQLTQGRSAHTCERAADLLGKRARAFCASDTGCPRAPDARRALPAAAIPLTSV